MRPSLVTLHVLKISNEKNSCIVKMGDFPQPQQKFAAAGENCDFLIAVKKT